MKFSTTAFAALTLITAAACGQAVTHQQAARQIGKAEAAKETAFALLFGDTWEQNRLVEHINSCEADVDLADTDLQEKQDDLDADDVQLVEDFLAAARSEIARARSSSAIAHARYDFGSAALPVAWMHLFNGMDLADAGDDAGAAAEYEQSLMDGIQAETRFQEAWFNGRVAERRIDDVPGGAQYSADQAQAILDAN